MKDVRVGAWYERKYVLGPGDDHKWTPEVVGLSIEATYEDAESAKQGIVDELEWLRAQVTAEVGATQQKAREPPTLAPKREWTDEEIAEMKQMLTDPENQPHQWISTMPPASSSVVATFTPPPKDPAEVPDMEVWYPKDRVGTLVSDLSLKDIEFYLGSNIVKNAKADDERVNAFVTALEYWRKQKGGS